VLVHLRVVLGGVIESEAHREGFLVQGSGDEMVQVSAYV
jgi:hypothetical protein